MCPTSSHSHPSKIGYVNLETNNTVQHVYVLQFPNFENKSGHNYQVISIGEWSRV